MIEIILLQILAYISFFYVGYQFGKNMEKLKEKKG